MSRLAGPIYFTKGKVLSQGMQMWNMKALPIRFMSYEKFKAFVKWVNFKGKVNRPKRKKENIFVLTIRGLLALAIWNRTQLLPVQRDMATFSPKLNGKQIYHIFI